MIFATALKIDLLQNFLSLPQSGISELEWICDDRSKYQVKYDEQFVQ